MRAARSLLIWSFAAGAVALLAWAGLTPIPAGGSRDEVFEIPKGTWERRRSGENIGILPDKIRLTLGIRDTLLLKNLDDVPQIFGPTLMMPGQSFRLPFEKASEYQFACTAHASGQMTVIVDPNPRTPWARILWRARTAKEILKQGSRSGLPW
ncbi:MAG TPA: hypothetical protein VGN07_16775 [Steroidobacteraceae bacterium]